MLSEPTNAEIINRLKRICRWSDNPHQLETPSVRLLTDWHKAMPTISPTNCILKDSWPYIACKESEQNMLMDTKDMFGLPNVICSYEEFYNKKGDHLFPMPVGAKYFNAYGSDIPDPIPTEPQKCTHSQTIVVTVGKRLEQAKGQNTLPQLSFT
jgi:hypothetical protein